MFAEVTDEQQHILRHALGINDRNNEPYRNHYAATPDDEDCKHLSSIGLLTEGVQHGALIFYCVTDKGKHFLGLPEPPEVE